MIKEYNSFPQEDVENFNYKLTEIEFSTNPYLKLITYVEKEKIRGFLLYSLIYDRIEIEQFEVTKTKRGKKIGSKLLSYLVNRYNNTSIKNITLEVKEDNIIAINLYKKYGFKKVSIREKYYDGVNGLLMEKKLYMNCYSYAMGFANDILNLKTQGFNIEQDEDNYKVIFTEDKASVWEEYVSKNLETGYWNEYLGKEITFIFKLEDETIKKYVLNDNNRLEILNLCRKFANYNFPSIIKMLKDNNFYKENYFKKENMHLN